MRPNRHPYHAFTLLEVMIVVGMAALVMAISIPFVQRTVRRDAIYTAVKVVEDACRNARAAAIVNNSTAELIIQPSEGRFSVRPGAARAARPLRAARDAAPALDANGEPRPVSNYSRQAPPPFSGTLGDDVVIQLLDVTFVEHTGDAEARVRFHANGTSDEFTIVFRIGATAVRQVSLDIVTGHPTLKVIR